MIKLEEITGSVGLIDNDLLMRDMQNFPNLALMKISSYLKSKGCNVSLTSFQEIDGFFKKDYYIIAKVFTDTFTPNYSNKNVLIGGSGFYYDKAEKLPFECEHMMPDYSLYDNCLGMITKGKEHFFKNHSIGFLTRGCIRKCEFCINKNYNKVEKASELTEFLDITKPYITLLDDNITAYQKFEDVINELKNTNKPFVFKQGMDFRLLNEKRMLLLNTCKKYGKTDKTSIRVFYFAFDNIQDKKSIEKNLILWNSIFPKTTAKMFYVLVGFDRNEKYDEAFWLKDYNDLIERIKILYENKAIPYIMRHKNLDKSPYLKQINIITGFCRYVMRKGNMNFKTYCEYENIDKSLFTKEILDITYEQAWTKNS